MFYYFAIPIVISLLGLRLRSSLWRVALFGAIAISTAIYCAAFIGPVLLIMFISGIFLYEAMRSTKTPSPGSLIGMVALFGAFAALLIPLPGSVVYVLKISTLFACFFIFCLACFKQPAGRLAKAFSWTPLRWLGNMSYSYYLIHGLALKAGFHALPKLIPQSAVSAEVFALLLLVMFVLTLIPATLLFLLIERPFSLSRHTAR
jgi:peptidoglycan/LPS O-acetylase OafA/YrhL